jgi:hypothetical protein
VASDRDALHKERVLKTAQRTKRREAKRDKYHDANKWGWQRDAWGGE